MIDMHLRVCDASGHHEIEKVEQCLLLGGEVMRPECGRDLVVIHEPEEVVETPLLLF